MGEVVKYLIGILILFAFGIFVVHSIKSFIEALRDRLKKKSPENKSDSSADDSDDDSRKGGAKTE